MQLPFDVQQFGRLARRDAERACVQFLSSCTGDPTPVLTVLDAEPPAEWPDDLVPLLSWVCHAASAEGPTVQVEEVVARLFHIDNIVQSPMRHVRKQLAPGDEISELLARRMGSSLFVLPGEGDRLVALEPAAFVIGVHLGYWRGAQTGVRAKRMRSREQDAIRRGWSRLEALRRDRGPVAFFEYWFSQLIECPNHDLPSTLRWLEALDPVTRNRLWIEVLRFQQRCALPPGRSPSVFTLRNRLQDQGIPAEPEHVQRLIRLADEWMHRLQPDPDVDRGHVQATREELEEYLSWESRASVLNPFLASEGIEALNQALVELACATGTSEQSPEVVEELVEFRESFLKRIHARPLMDLAPLDPAAYLAGRLAANQGRIIPAAADPDALEGAWTRLNARMEEALDSSAASESTATAEEEPLPPLSDLSEGIEFASAQEFFDIDEDMFPSLELDAAGNPLDGPPSKREATRSPVSAVSRRRPEPLPPPVPDTALGPGPDSPPGTTSRTEVERPTHAAGHGRDTVPDRQPSATQAHHDASPAAPVPPFTPAAPASLGRVIDELEDVARALDRLSLSGESSEADQVRHESSSGDRKPPGVGADLLEVPRETDETPPAAPSALPVPGKETFDSQDWETPREHSEEKGSGGAR